MNNTVDLWFRIRGETLPALHGYALYACLCRLSPSFHAAPWLGVHTVWGRRLGDRTIQVPRNAKLGLRLPGDHISDALVLTGRTLDIEGHRLSVGVPEIRTLQPAPAVSARMVTIKGFTEPGPFRDAVVRQLTSLGIEGEVSVGARGVQRISNKLVVGFATTIAGLSPEHSLQCQHRGIGGRRRMGCGLFQPTAEHRT